jgi:xylulokinase
VRTSAPGPSPARGGSPYVEPVHALGIDVGSTNVKVAMVDDEGRLRGAASRPLVTHQDGAVAEQDPDALWSSVAEAVREVTASEPARAALVAAVGVCSQYSSIVAVDRAGAATSSLLMYTDQRGTERCWELMAAAPAAFDTWVERHGIPPIGGGLSLAHLLHLQHDRPDVHERTAAYLEVVDLVNLRLTGRAAATQCTMFASQLCDNRTVGTTSYDAELLRLSGIDPSRLPELVPVDGAVGELTRSAAELLGLPAGVVVSAGMNDTQAAAFATGTATEQPARAGSEVRCGVAIGTTAVMVRPLRHKSVDLDREVLSMPAPIPDRHLVMAENGLAGRAVEQALGTLSPPGGPPPFEELAAALEASPPGAGGLLFLPWLGGSMSPSSSSRIRGGFVNMSLATTRTDLLRATVEGVARNLRWLAPAVDDLAGGPADTFVLAGGAARSRGWAQVVADVLGRPVEVLERPEVAAARAVALVALRRTMHGGVADDVVEVAVPVTARLEPDPAAVAVHEGVQPAFEDAFAALLPVCEALQP